MHLIYYRSMFRATSTPSGGGPSRGAIAAFGAKGDPVPLGGGRGLAWQIGDLVFKPADLTLDELIWQADVLPTVEAHDVRLSAPQRAVDGKFVIEGWTAWPYLPGEHLEAHWLDVITVGDRLHQAMAGLARPSFVGNRTDPWAIGDRVAWGEAPISPYRDIPHVGRLAEHLRPVDAQSQLIHGDLTGNVLFADGLPPGIIDLSLYWRPAGFASAIVVADALVWEGADESLVVSLAEVDQLAQMLTRALIYRLVAAVEGGIEDEYVAIERHYRAAVDLACHRIDTSAT